MTLSVFLRNPAKCRGPERSASGLRAGTLPSAHPAGAAALHSAQRQEAMLLTAWLPALRGWCTVVRSGAKGIVRYEAGDGIVVRMSTKEHQQPKLSSVSSRSSSSGSSDGRRSCRRCDYVQRLQQITKLNRWSCQLLLDDGANRLPQAFVCGCLAVWKNMYACAGATHSAILRCCRTVEPLGLAFRQCSLYPHTHFSLHLSRGLMTGQPGTFLLCYVPW